MSKFWLGFTAALGYHMFWQDLLGKEKFIAYVNVAWIDLHWAIGLTIAIIATIAAFSAEK